MFGHHISKLSWTGLVLIGVFVFLANLLPVSAEDAVEAAAKKETNVAVQAMESWLGIIDKGDYIKSWDEAAQSFKKGVTSEKWTEMAKGVRAPLGKMIVRSSNGAIYQTGLLSATGIRQGQYVIAQFDTTFENLKSARETVTFEKEADGTWRASGYYIKPN